MSRPRSWAWSAGLVFLSTASAVAEPAPLPLTRVRLYETGVGYFERTGGLGSKAMSLPVPASHLDDALKTLVVLSTDARSSVTGIEFGSSVSRSMARSLAGLPSEEGALKLHSLLASLKGANVELKAGKTKLTGRIVELVETEDSDLEECTKAVNADKNAPCSMRKLPTLVLLTQAGEIRRFRVDEVTSVRPTDQRYARRLSSAVDALSDGAPRVLKDLKLLAKSSKQLSLGYVAEAPVWRSSYRLVLGGGDHKGALQGWALLHNDTDEDWTGVKVELVNGRPDSFLFPLAAPRYARRELVTPDNPLSTVPQLMDTTADTMWTGDEGASGLGLTGVGEGGGGRGEGIGLGSIGTLGHGAGTGTGSGDSASSAISVGNLAGLAKTEGVEAGALFRYSIAESVKLAAHGSALVPFHDGGVDARRIALFTEAGQTARSAVHLTHQGQQTLPGGPLAVFDDGGFAGESVLERMKPKETQVIEFGTDLDVELASIGSSAADETKLLGFEGGKLVEHFVRHHTVRYRLENRSGSARDAFLRLSYVDNAKVEGADELAYDSRAKGVLAVFKIGARSKAERTLKVDEGLSRKHAPAKLGSRGLERMAGWRAVPARQKKIVVAAVARLREAEAKRASRRQAGTELAELNLDILRLREHARALRGAHGSEGIVERLLAAEDKAKSLRARRAKLEREAADSVRKASSELRRL